MSWSAIRNLQCRTLLKIIWCTVKPTSAAVRIVVLYTKPRPPEIGLWKISVLKRLFYRFDLYPLICWPEEAPSFFNSWGADPTPRDRDSWSGLPLQLPESQVAFWAVDDWLQWCCQRRWRTKTGSFIQDCFTYLQMLWLYKICLHNTTLFDQGVYDSE